MADTKSVREEIIKRRRELGEFERQAKNECNHKDNHGSTLVPVSEYDGFIKDRNKYDEFDMICTDCGEIVSFRTFTPSEIEFSISTIRSMGNQLKVLGNLSDTEYEQIVDIMNITDGFNAAFVPFYNHSMKKLLGNNQKNKNNNNGSRKGRMGKAVTSQSFNRH